MAARQTPLRKKHVPQRTCVGCRAVQPKRGLIRIVRTPQGVVIDPTGKQDGRGAYLHDLRSCWQAGMQGSLERALKISLTAEDILRLQEFYAKLGTGESDV